MNGYQIVSESINRTNLLSDLGYKKLANSLGFEKLEILETPDFKITQTKLKDQPSQIKIDGKAQQVKLLLIKLRDKDRPHVEEDDITYNNWIQQACDEAIEGIDNNPSYKDPEKKCRVTITARS
jgi:hypothetical protein